ncbi:MAG: permease prefix domain 1-containing protein [Clostridiaceae bacterium]|jgi:hypothetical protein|nr:permease prefix domain 1-containing protein [Clostridiaceae bacterium]
MKEKFQRYLDRKFFVYFKSAKLNEYKEELLSGMLERYEAYKAEKLSDDEAYKRTLERFGDVAAGMPASDLRPDKRETVVRAGRYVIAAALYWMLIITVYLSVCLLGNYAGQSYWGVAAKYTFPFAGLLFVCIALFGGFRTSAVYKKGALPRLTLAAAIMTVGTFIYLLISFIVDSRSAWSVTWSVTWIIFPISMMIALLTDLIVNKGDNKAAKIVKIALLGAAVFIAAYLGISFITGAWKITWIMFLFAVIAGLVFGLVKLGGRSVKGGWQNGDTEAADLGDDDKEAGGIDPDEIA